MSPEQRTFVLRICQGLAGVPERALERLAAIAEPLHLPPGATLIREGEHASDLFVLVSGTVEVRQRNAEGGEDVLGRTSEAGPRGERAIFGEMQVLTGGRRTATVCAVTEVELLRLSHAPLTEIGEAHPELYLGLAELSREHLRKDQLRAALRTNIGSDDEALLRALDDVVQWQPLGSGQALVRQGEPSDAIYFLLRGRLRCVAEDEANGGSGPVVLDEILPGESLGETAVFREQTRGATVWATRSSEVARVDREHFIQLSREHPSLLLSTLETVVERQQRRVRTPRAGLGAHTIALVPLSARVPMAQLVAKLVPELEQLTSVVYVDRPGLERRLVDPELADLEDAHPRSLRVVTLMDELERGADHVVYEADRLDSGWTRRCVRSADELVLMAHAADAPTPSSLEHMLTRIEPELLRPHTTLVLLHPHGTTPQNTRAWLDQRTVHRVLHVAMDRRADHARLARFLTGQAVGVVLSGGAARGLAGLGMIEAMGELGIPIDAVGGVSSGALVAAACAAGLSSEALIDHFFRPRSALRMMDLNVPLVSLWSARGFTTVLRDLFGDIHIEDLWLPSLYVSTNLTRACQRVSTRGNLCEALTATNAMPGIFPPVVIDGDLHVDGAFLNNVPIAELDRIVRGGPVIALDVTPTVEFEHDRKADEGLDGWRGLRDKLLGRAEHATMPNVLELLMRSQVLHHVAHVREVKGLAELYLQPELGEFGLAQHHRARAIARAGRQQTIGSLRTWWEGYRATRHRAPSHGVRNQ